MDNSLATLSPADLRGRLADLMHRDQRRLQRRLDGVRKSRRPGALEQVAAEIEAAERRIERRRAAVPAVTYPEALPVSQRRDDLLAAIRDNQVVIVAGETGSGKTTQLPKICLELGRGVRGLIGHTQPRRLAARTVAERIAEELDTPLGEAVGYTVRFTDHVGENTLVKLMTDGILLAEIQRDRTLSRYDTLIIDEAHERSLNIDFILGYLRDLLPRRPDLKVIITSATIDPQRFAAHFDGAPIVEVSGRTYPVEVRYRPLIEEASEGDSEDIVRDQTEAICEAVDELYAEPPGDVLVFLSGEREIRDTADALAKRNLRNTEIVPLYARLSSAEQHRVFQPHTGRRVVLATNVAETSLTVPGIRYVVDPGTARISRYSLRTKVQRLPIERISQASANQRKGRCGRVAEGICIRLYSEEDFESRPAFTDPEILRTNLASVILQMTALGLGDIAAFPFVEAPDRRNIKDGVDLLHELGALDVTQSDPKKRLTILGRSLAQLPIDPRLARMIIEADRNGCVREVVVIAAALSIQDPRERPLEKQQAAAEKHARFADPQSDFLSLLNLWQYLREQQEELSSNQFRRLCKSEFLNYLRIREWQDLVSQLRQVTKTLGIAYSTSPEDGQGIHRSMLAGLLSHLGLKDADKNEYLGARGAKFAVFPGSALFKKPPRWLMVAELVETSRLWGRVAAKIEPEWAEQLAPHLVKRTYSEPHWEAKRGGVVAFEKVMLYGIPIVASRKVDYGRIDPEVSRELFIRHALVEGDWRTHHKFFQANRDMLADVEELENRVRRRDIVVDDETMFAFYDARIPADMVSGRHFDAWWKQARRTQPDLLTFTESMLVSDEAGALAAAEYPDAWHQGDLALPLSYQFEPGTAADGVTVHIPLPVLNRVDPAGFDWQIPGLRLELVTALIKSLPKALRVNFVPAPDRARAALQAIGPDEGPLLTALADELYRMTRVSIPRDAWALDRVPDHLRVTFRVEDAGGRVRGEGKDLDALKRQLAPRVRVTMAEAAVSIERGGLTSWPGEALPRTFEHSGAGGHAVKGYPALVDEGATVAVRVLGSVAEQEAAHWRGVRRLLLLTTANPLRAVLGGLSNRVKLALGRSPYGDVPALLDDAVTAAVDRLIEAAGGPPRDAAGFEALRETVRTDLPGAVVDTVGVVAEILTSAHAVESRISSVRQPALLGALTDIRTQLAGLVFEGFVSSTGCRRLPDVLRYLQGIERRLDKLAENPNRDREWTARVEAVREAYRDLVLSLPPARRQRADVRQIRWMIEELRVSLFAQSLKTAYPVSEQRIYKAMDQLPA